MINLGIGFMVFGIAHVLQVTVLIHKIHGPSTCPRRMPAFSSTFHRGSLSWIVSVIR